MSTDATNITAPALEVRNLNVYYGRAHALQDISLTLHSGVLGVVGRNGMGKTTLCNAITGLVPARGTQGPAGGRAGGHAAAAGPAGRAPDRSPS